MAARLCVFCRRHLGANRAKEHVIPAWLLQLLGISMEQLVQGIANATDGTVIKRRSLALKQFVEGRVCDNCNHGWMSDLENEAKPLVAELVNGSRTVYGLSDNERLTLALWSAKTAYVITYAGPLRNPVKVSHLKVLSARQLTEGVTVLANQHQANRHLAYCQKTTWPTWSDSPSQKRKAHGYKVGLQLNNLLLLVAYHPPPRTYVLSAGVHVPIWPIQDFHASRYPNTDVPLPYDSYTLLLRFSDLLGVIYARAPAREYAHAD